MCERASPQRPTTTSATPTSTSSSPPAPASGSCAPTPRRTEPGARNCASQVQQRLEIFPEDGLLLLLREARHPEDPCHRPVEGHVVRPVGAEHHAVGAHPVDEVTKG